MARKKKEPMGRYLIEVPEEVMEDALPILKRRGIKLDAVVTVYLRALIVSAEHTTMRGLEDAMPFGKYRGATIEHVIRTDPRYINWLLRTADNFLIDEKAAILLRGIGE